MQIKGFGELAKVLKQLPNDIKDKEARAEMKRQMRPLQREMKRLVGKKTGNLSSAIRFKDGRPKPDKVDVWLGVQNRVGRAAHWHIVHEGTKLRKIDGPKASPATRRKLTTGPNGEKGLMLSINGNQLRFVTNTGVMPAKKYVEKAAEMHLQPAADNMLKKQEKQIYKKIIKLKKKYNLK
jgi:hypothetical protein